MLIAATGPNLFWQIVIFVVGVPLMLLVLWVAVLPIFAISGLAIPHVPRVLRNLWRNRRSVLGSAGFVGGFWFVPDLVGRWIPTQIVQTFMEERDWTDLPGGDFLVFFWTVVWFLNAVPYGLGVLAGCACIGSLLALIPGAADRPVYRGRCPNRRPARPGRHRVPGRQRDVPNGGWEPGRLLLHHPVRGPGHLAVSGDTF